MNTSRHQTVASWVFGTLFFIVLTIVLLQPASIPPNKQGIVALFCAMMGALFTFFIAGQIAVTINSNEVGKTVISATSGLAVFAIIFTCLLKYASAIPAIPASPSVPIPVPTTSSSPSVAGGTQIPEKQPKISTYPRYLILRPKDPVTNDSCVFISVQTFHDGFVPNHGKPGAGVTKYGGTPGLYVSFKPESGKEQTLDVFTGHETPLFIGQTEFSLTLENLTDDNVAKIQIQEK